MPKINRWVVIAVPIRAMFVFGILTAEAATIHVDDDTCPATGSGTMADPFCKIQAAINAADNGDEVLVAAGTYVENITLNGTKTITVKTNYCTVIDGNASGSVVSFTGGDTSTLDGFTITN